MNNDRDKPQQDVDGLRRSLEEGERLCNELLARVPDFFSPERAMRQHLEAMDALALERSAKTPSNKIQHEKRWHASFARVLRAIAFWAVRSEGRL
jgi:hypothetical protein